MDKKIKILHILQSDRFSGAENVVCQIINIFKDDYHMAYCSMEGSIREVLNKKNIEFYSLSKLCIKEVKRVIREYNPDIIHAHDARASLIAAAASFGIPIISHIHGNHENKRKLSLNNLAYLATCLRFRKIIWVSDSAFDNYIFKNSLRSKSLVLYNVIDTEEIYKKLNEDNNSYDYDIVYVGRLTYPKNPLRLIKVFKYVINQCPEIKIAIAGSGDLLIETKCLVNSLCLCNSISFLGFKENPFKLINDAKVFVMTSIYEGTPMTALEAMALGKPIVSTPTDGMKVLVEDNSTGYLSDDDKDLAKKITMLVTNKSLRDKFSKNTLNRFNNLNDVKEYKNILKSIYSEMVKYYG